MLTPDDCPIHPSRLNTIRRLLKSLNRTERSITHKSLLQIRRTASDKHLSDNRNILACRMTRDDRVQIQQWCLDNHSTVSEFARDAVRERLRRLRRAA